MYTNLSIWFLVVGVLILASNLIDVPYLISKLFAKSKAKVEIIETVKKEEGFLEIVNFTNKSRKYKLAKPFDELIL